MDTSIFVKQTQQTMNWKLILALSMFGLFMAIGTVYFIPMNVEMICWPVIFIICAYFIAKRAPGKLFLHGLYLGLTNCFWILATHLLLLKSYMEFHPDQQKFMDAPMMTSHPRMSMVLIGIFIGIVSGIVIGLLSWIAGKLVKK